MAKLNEMYKTPITALLLAACLVSAALFYAGTSRAVAGAASSPGAVHADGFAFTSLSTKAAWITQGEVKGGEYGKSAASAGDVNGDSFADVIVGAPLYDLEGAGVDNGGAAFVFYGTPNGLPLHPEWSVGGDVKGSRYGSSVASAGDVNGDGYDDVIVGAYRYKYGELDSEEGAAFLYYGSEDGLSPAAGWQVESDQPYAQLGYAVAGAGDLNADGFDDLAVGARWYMVDEDNEGAVFVFYGSKDGPSSQPDLILEGDQTGATFGSALGCAGDVNGDGFDDLAVGAPDFDYEEADAGAVFVFHGSKDGLREDWDWRAISDKAEAWFGVSTGTAGDVNGDGFSDVVVGAPGYEYEPASLGSVFVYQGSKDGLSETESLRADSGQSSAWFGSSVSAAGDVDDDGFDDVIVGAYKYTEQNQEGRAFVFYGTPGGLQPYYEWWAAGDKAEAWFGSSVGSAGDVDKDGYDDVIVGAYNYRLDKLLVGRAYVYLGEQSETPLPTPTGEPHPDITQVFLPLLTR